MVVEFPAEGALNIKFENKIPGISVAPILGDTLVGRVLDYLIIMSSVM